MNPRTRKILFGALPSNLVYWSVRDIKQNLLATMWNWSMDSTSMRRKLHIPGKSLWPFWDGYPFKGCWWPPTIADKKVAAWISWSKLLTLPKFNRKRPPKKLPKPNKKGSCFQLSSFFRGISCETWGQFTSPRHLRARFRGRWWWDGGYRFRDRWNEDLKNSTNTASAKGTPQKHEGRSSWGISSIIEGLPCIGTW